MEAVRDPDGTVVKLVYTFLNEAAARLYGKSVDEVLGHGRCELFPSAKEAGIWDTYMGVIESGSPRSFDVPYFNENDVEGSFRLTATKFGDGLLVSANDTTAQVKAEKALEADRATLRATLDSLMDPHVLFEAVHDERGQIVDFRFADANPAACAYDGIAYQDLVGSRMLEHYPGVVGAGLLKQYTQVVETGQPLRLDDVVYPMETMGSQDRYLDISAARVGDGLSYTWRDVTDRHVAAARLAEWQDRYRLLAENASDVVFMAGSDRRIGWIAPSVTAALGWDPEELVGTQLADLFRPDFKIATVQDRVELYTKGHDVNPEGGFLFELRTKSGDYRWMSGHEHALTDPDGTPVGVVGGLRDVNDLVRARQEAQRQTGPPCTRLWTR
jgi:PAS domain S-box-containing protein